MRLLSDGPASVAEFWAAHRDGEPVGLRTSGTSSGVSRIIVRTTDSWVGSFDATSAWLGLRAGERVWIPGTFRATMNLFAATLAELVGATWGAERDGADLAQVTPAGLSTLVSDAEAGATVPPRALVAGDGLTRALRDRAREAGIEVFHYYGAAELSLVAVGTCADDLELFDQVEAQVTNDVLWIRSPWLSQGYAAADPDAPWRVSDDGFATVGDVGELHGTHLRVLGRPGAITSGGATVTIAPLRARLQQQTAALVQVVGLPHPSLGHVVCCVVDDEAAIAPLRAWARDHLDGANRPRRWVAVNPFPTTRAGKIDVAALTEAARRMTGGAR